MSDASLWFKDDALACPVCNGTATRVGTAFAVNAANQRVDIVADGSDVEATLTVRFQWTDLYTGRQHSVGFCMDCESCAHTSTILLTQVNGVTLVSLDEDRRHGLILPPQRNY